MDSPRIGGIAVLPSVSRWTPLFSKLLRFLVQSLGVTPDGLNTIKRVVPSLILCFEGKENRLVWPHPYFGHCLNLRIQVVFRIWCIRIGPPEFVQVSHAVPPVKLPLATLEDAVPDEESRSCVGLPFGLLFSSRRCRSEKDESTERKKSSLEVPFAMPIVPW